MNWQDVLTDKSLQNLPYKIELNKTGRIEMSPATNWHAYWQYEIAGILREQLRSKGMGFTEASIDTLEGVKVADVAWMSNQFYKLHKHQTPFLEAPEICVEIVSPSNTQEEMLEKQQLYFERGASEVWFCTLKGQMQFFDKDGKLEYSALVKNFPQKLEI